MKRWKVFFSLHSPGNSHMIYFWFIHNSISGCFFGQFLWDKVSMFTSEIMKTGGSLAVCQQPSANISRREGSVLYIQTFPHCHNAVGLILDFLMFLQQKVQNLNKRFCILLQSRFIVFKCKWQKMANNLVTAGLHSHQVGTMPHAFCFTVPPCGPRLVCTQCRGSASLQHFLAKWSPTSGACERHLNCSINCLCAEKQYLKERSPEDVTPVAAIIWKVVAN